MAIMDIDINQIDTCGFPYVYGIMPSVYKSMPLPSSEEEVNEMLRDLSFVIGDITNQLRINNADEIPNNDWKISALTKLRSVKQQYFLLQKVKSNFVKLRIACIDSDGSEYVKKSRVAELERKLEGTNNKLEKLRQNLHSSNTRLDLMRSFLFRFLIEYKNDNVDSLIQEYSEILERIEPKMKPDYGSIKF
jgi:hypothetical protein